MLIENATKCNFRRFKTEKARHDDRKTNLMERIDQTNKKTCDYDNSPAVLEIIKLFGSELSPLSQRNHIWTIHSVNCNFPIPKSIKHIHIV